MLPAVVLSLAVSLGASEEPVKLALPGLTFVKVDREIAGFFSEHLAQKLTFAGLKVTSSADIAAVLGFERQKALLGCSEAAASNCMIELANALGVDGIVSGSIGKFGDTFQVNLKVISASDGSVLCANSSSAKTEAQVLEKLDLAAASFGRQLRSRFEKGRFVPAEGPLADAVRLASPGLRITRVDRQTGLFLEEHFQQQLIFNKALLLTSRDIAKMLGQERQKRLLGCNTDACQAELSTQLEADGVLTGQITKLGEGFRFNFKVLGSGGESLGLASAMAGSQVEALEVLKGAAKELAQQVRQAVEAKRREEAARAKASALADEKRRREEEARAKAEALEASRRRDEELRAKAREEAGPRLTPVALAEDPVAAALAPAPRRWPVVPTVVGAILVAAGAGALIGSTQVEGDTVCDYDGFGMLQCSSPGKSALLIGGIAGAATGAALISIAGIVYAVRAPSPEAAPAGQPPPAPPPPVLAPTASLVPGGVTFGLAGRF